MTSKQRAYLRGLANGIDAIIQIGKDGLGDALIKTVSDALEARELIKLTVLENSGYDPKEAAEIIANAINAEVVCVTGRKAVLYKRSYRNDIEHIVL